MIVVEVGRTWAGDGRAKKNDTVLGRLAACLDVRAVEGYDRLRWQTAGGEAGGQTRAARVAVAEVDGRAVGLEEEVPDGITSITLMFRKEYPARWANVELTEVKSLPGSPNDDRQEISSLPRGRIAPGSCRTGIAGGLISLRM